MIKIIFLLISFLTCSSYKTSQNNVANIVVKKSLNIKEKEVSFHYVVTPVIYDDEILYSYHYVLGNDNYFSPVFDNPIEINHDTYNQILNIKCLHPFDKRIIIKLFSAKNNNAYVNIVLDYKEKFELTSCKLSFDEINNHFYLSPNLDISIGSIKMNKEIKYKSIEFNKDFITDIKKEMTNIAQKKIYAISKSNDIVFEHKFENFDSSYALSLFSSSKEKVFSKFLDEVSYSYYDYEKDLVVNETKTFNVYDLLVDEFFYQNRIIFDISFSIEEKSYNQQFSYEKTI